MVGRDSEVDYYYYYYYYQLRIVSENHIIACKLLLLDRNTVIVNVNIINIKNSNLSYNCLLRVTISYYIISLKKRTDFVIR